MVVKIYKVIILKMRARNKVCLMPRGKVKDAVFEYFLDSF